MTSFIRIIESGYEGFTGDFGVIPFENGVSTREVSEKEAMRISNIIRVERLDGTNPSASQRVLESQRTEMAVIAAQAPKALIEEEEPRKRRLYTVAELGAIADARGMTGLREISGPLGIRSRSVSDLIAQIIDKQAQGQRAGDPVSEPPQQ
jgi:hypothetical protein